MKKKVFIIIGAAVFIIAVIIGIFSVKDLQQEKALHEEISSIQKLTDAEEMDMDAINKKLKRTVTTGDYAKVEKAVKNYLLDNLNNAISIAEALNDEVLMSALTADNYVADGPDFVKTKLLIGDLREQLTKAKEELNRLAEEKTIMSYLKDTEDSYSVDLYKEIMAEEETSAEDLREIEQSIDEVLDVLTVEQQVIDFLSANKGQWLVQDGNIAFASDELANQYNQLLLELQ